MTHSIGSRLLEERERFGLSQNQICDLTGVSRKTQFSYEKSVRLPDAGYLSILAVHNLDVLYIVTGKRAPRYGTVNEELLRNVFTAVETALSSANQSVSVEKKAKLVALVYQTASDTGQVDPLVAQKAIDLLS
jgi:transcriptional regulator with XRE-family HTH domain